MCLHHLSLRSFFPSDAFSTVSKFNTEGLQSSLLFHLIFEEINLPPTFTWTPVRGTVCEITQPLFFFFIFNAFLRKPLGVVNKKQLHPSEYEVSFLLYFCLERVVLNSWSVLSDI